MKLAPSAVLLLALQACGTGEPSTDGHALRSSEDERLNGTWVLDANANACVMAWSFEAPEYTFALICGRSDGSADEQKDEGLYSFDGSSIEVDPQRTTCPKRVVRGTIAARTNGDTFTLSSPSGALVFDSYEPASAGGSSSGGVAIRFGCFSQDWSFAPGKLVDL